MILICNGYNKNCRSHEEVIDWLLYKGIEYDCWSGEQHYHQGESWSVALDNENTSPKKSYNSIWFRSFLSHNRYLAPLLNTTATTNKNLTDLRWHLGQEIVKVNNQIFNKFKDAYQLPNPEAIKVDKFKVLHLAKEEGLQIPNSLVTNCKKELKKFHNKHKEIITKPLYENPRFQEENYTIQFLTDKITYDQLNELPSTFFPSFFQAYIKKDIEVRVFFIDGLFYSMAIFSQLDPQTKTDFRNYNRKRPNRKVPYLLPEKIEVKLKGLMKKLNLTTGSIDLIKTPTKKYVFLEVNPIGQFGFVSKSCNYHLEHKIANTLIKYDR